MARICIIRQYYFPLDIRVRRQVDVLAQAGHSVDLICLKRAEEPSFERNGLVTIRRVPMQHRRNGMSRYLFEYMAFFLMAMTLSAALHIRRRYDVVQVYSMPDALVFAAVIPRLLGARVLLDLLECMPEFFATKFRTDPTHPGVRVVAWLEQASIRFADHVITCTEPMRQAFIVRGGDPNKITVVLNTADEAVFDVAKYPPREREEGRLVLISHGTVEERYGLDTVIRAVALLKDEIRALRFEVYGEGSYLSELHRLAAHLGVERQVYFSGGFVPMEELLEAIASSDAGVVAMKQDAFRDLTLCNKMFEYIALHKPVICSRTRSVQSYFDESCFLMFDSDDEHSLAQAIRILHADRLLSDTLARRATLANTLYRWPHQREIYAGIIDTLSTGKVRRESDSTVHREPAVFAGSPPKEEAEYADPAA